VLEVTLAQVHIEKEYKIEINVYLTIKIILIESINIKRIESNLNTDVLMLFNYYLS